MGSFDWITDFAGKLPMDVISEMMGVPEEDRAEVRRQADIVVHREDGVHDVPPAGAEASMWLVVYYQAMVDQRRRQPTDDLTSALIEAELRRRAAQRRGRHRVPVPHGRRRQRDHDQAARPRALPPDPAPGPARPGPRRRRRRRRSVACPGSRRRCASTPPASCWRATCSRDVELHGAVAPQGSKLLLCLGSANRDERVFSRPDRLRHHPRQGRARADPVLRRRPALLPRRQPGPARGAGRADRARRAGPVGRGRPRPRAVRVHSVNVRGFASMPTRVEAR